jgi:hypothetical protein
MAAISTDSEAAFRGQFPRSRKTPSMMWLASPLSSSRPVGMASLGDSLLVTAHRTSPGNLQVSVWALDKTESLSPTSQLAGRSCNRNFPLRANPKPCGFRSEESPGQP